MNNLGVSSSGTELTIKDNQSGASQRVHMSGNIRKAVVSQSLELIFVVIEFAGDQPNLFCIDASSAVTRWTKRASQERSKKNVYVDVELRSDKGLEELFVWDWDGYRSILDQKTGTIKESHFYK